MQTFFKTLLIAAFVFTVAVIGGVVATYSHPAPEKTLGDNPSAGQKFLRMATSSVQVGPGNSTVVIATSTTRGYLTISNNSANSVYLCFTSANCGANLGYLLTASSTYVENNQNMYYGQITGFSTGASSTLLVSQNI